MDLEFDEDKNTVFIRLTGPLNKETILNAFDAAVSDDCYKDGMGRLWDFRDADLSSFDTSLIKDMAQYSLKFPPGINDVKVAFVASRSLEFGLARMFEGMSASAKTTIAVFYSMDEAVTWMVT